MSFCHGNGDLARDGCCYVAGDICPLRWRITDGHIFEVRVVTVEPDPAPEPDPIEPTDGNSEAPDPPASEPARPSTLVEEVDLGPVDAFIDSLISNPRGRVVAKEQVQGATFICRAAAEVLIEDFRRLKDRAAFEAAWNAHPDYVALVRPHWSALEEALGLAPGAYQCSSWRPAGQCCFGEPEVDNEAKASGLSADARELRRQGA